jgi:plasmid stability protein
LRRTTLALAYCDMRTLYLRNVPDDVVDRLEQLAALQGTSVNMAAVRELDESTRRVGNAELLAGAPDLGVEVGDIVAAIHDGRLGR